MRIKVDEDLPAQVAQLLCAKGHDAVTVCAQGMGGWKDTELWGAVQAEGRFLVTADKGFGDIRTHAPGTHAGVLLLRPDYDGIWPLLELLQQVLLACDLEILRETVTVATPRSIRVRRG